MNFDSLQETLPLMLQGMGGIFIVVLLIYIMMKILLKVFPPKA
ncbi:OadG-related small transporter subunit [Clostridium hydrogeniformans]|nr:OadG-related small transporter subunit [Clostridium hydrogeniformans]